MSLERRGASPRDWLPWLCLQSEAPLLPKVQVRLIVEILSTRLCVMCAMLWCQQLVQCCWRVRLRQAHKQNSSGCLYPAAKRSCKFRNPC